jgi:hypothetical protein
MNTEKTIGIQRKIDTEAEVDPVEGIDPGMEGIGIIEEIDNKCFIFFKKPNLYFIFIFLFFYFFIFLFFIFLYYNKIFLIFNDNNKIL